MIGDSNSNSYPLIEMTLNRMDFQSGRLSAKTAMGVWKAGMPGNFTFKPGSSLRPFAVISVYKVAVVIVSDK